VNAFIHFLWTFDFYLLFSLEQQCVTLNLDTDPKQTSSVDLSYLIRLSCAGLNFIYWRGCWTTYHRFKYWIIDANPHEFLSLNRWFKFEPAVDSKQFSSTSLHLIPIGPDLMNNETWLNRIDVVQPILLVKPAHKISGSNTSAQFSYTLLNLGPWTNRLI